MYTYFTKGTCSKQINFELDSENRVHDVVFFGGCNGNLKAIAKLVEGMEASKVIEILEGNLCGVKKTSCADQLAKALKERI